MHYVCWVNLFGRAGLLGEANLFISAMPVEPDAVTWEALLGAGRTHGKLQLGKFAAEELSSWNPMKLDMYSSLTPMLRLPGGRMCLWCAMMEERGIGKEPGRRWIGVDNKVHQFVVGDVCHPEAKEIKAHLKELTGKLKAEGYIPDTRLVLHDINKENKEVALCSHIEKLATACGLIHIPREEPIRVTKNLSGVSRLPYSNKFDL